MDGPCLLLTQFGSRLCVQAASQCSARDEGAVDVDDAVNPAPVLHVGESEATTRVRTSLVDAALRCRHAVRCMLRAGTEGDDRPEDMGWADLEGTVEVSTSLSKDRALTSYVTAAAATTTAPHPALDGVCGGSCCGRRWCLSMATTRVTRRLRRCTSWSRCGLTSCQLSTHSVPCVCDSEPIGFREAGDRGRRSPVRTSSSVGETRAAGTSRSSCAGAAVLCVRQREGHAAAGGRARGGRQQRPSSG